MKITKNSYAEIRKLYDDLSFFLAGLKYDELNFRMVIIEYSRMGNETEIISYFDSGKNQIVKETLENKNFGKFKDDKVLAYVKASPETAIIETLALEEAAKHEKLSAYYVVFDFKDKVTMLLSDFLRRYQKCILELFNYRSQLNIDELTEKKKEMFDDAVKEYIDLDIVNNLAGSSYEKRESSGSLFYVKNRSDAKYSIKLSKEIDFNSNNMRLIRKVLEMSDRKYSLVIYKKKIVGLGTKDTPYRKVQFNGHQNWTLGLTQKESLRFINDRFFFDRGYNQLATELPKGLVLKKNEKAFSNLISFLTRQKRGAMLIITNHAKQEVERLSGFNRGYAITPIDFTHVENLPLIRSLTAVDGAVFLDQQLKCYGTGIILDGIAQRCGSSARGARYNSACCYLDNKTDALYVAIVLSEDETIDVIKNNTQC